MEATNCPKCDGLMEQGFVPTMTNKNFRGVLKWHRGTPKKSFWWGVKTTPATIPIGTMRCTACGYLEFYARAAFQEQ